MSKFTVVRSEEDVGILHRIGNVNRFQGIFKGRYSDFHVNEIDLNGKIVQLTSLAVPAGEKSEIAEDDPQICSWIPEDVRESIRDLQNKLKDSSFNNVGRKDPVWKESVEVKVTTLGKEERTRIHKWLGNFDKVHSETVEKNGEKFIVVLYDNKNNRSRRRPATRAKYTHCTMYKEGVDTSEAIGLLSKKLRIKPSFITYCGTKDKYGKTTQRICISNIDAHHLAQISKETRSIKLGNFEYLPHHLRLGDLKGNHFKILLRNVVAESDEFIAAAVESLKVNGYINYFGLQRFGSYEVSTHAIGKSILQNNWMEAFDLILKPKNNDPDFMIQAKNDWFNNRDPNEAIKKLPHWHRSLESSLLHGLAKYYGRNDYIGVFLRIPRNMRHLYIHSFQSYLWNYVASHRIKEMGPQPVVGDLVFEDKEQEDFFFEEEDQLSDDESGSNIHTNQNLLVRQSKVKTLTAEDLPNYTIFDVLIPMQGTQITIPEGYVKTFYDKLLSEQGLDPDCFLKFKPIADQPKGAYRKICVRPQNVSYKIIQYNDSDPVDSFIPSEIDRLNAPKNNKNGSESNQDEQQAEPAEDSASENILVKDKKCVIVELSLPSSSYATMALREILIPTSPEPASTKRSAEETDKSEPEAKKQKDA